jgi:hypothetical protein
MIQVISSVNIATDRSILYSTLRHEIGSMALPMLQLDCSFMNIGAHHTTPTTNYIPSI